MLGTEQKRTDAQIYILGHKPLEYGYIDNKLYTPLQVGAAYKPQFLPLTDNTGDNIGIWNPVFAESTGLYWIAHNAPETMKYLGNCQYRRRILFDQDTDFDKIFNKCQILVSEPLLLGISLYDQYAHCHTKAEIDTIKSVVADLYPEYMDSWVEHIEKGNLLLYSTAFVMSREHYVQYAQFFTDIAFETLKRMGLNTPEQVREYARKAIDAKIKPNNDGKFGEKDPVSYQMQLAGFWQERLATLFIFHNFNKIVFVPFKKYEFV